MQFVVCVIAQEIAATFAVHDKNSPY